MSTNQLIVFLHWLGGSAASWDVVVRDLESRGHRCVAVDLPGFGAATDDHRYSVAEMVEAVASKLEVSGPWSLVGHSMGGKVASALARAAADGDPRLVGLESLVLVSASPPEPEPMSESKRTELLQNQGRADATKFVEDNVGEPPLDAPALEKAVGIVLGNSPAAWMAWLASGSKEDWGARVGKLPQPVLLICGEKESDLGAETQRAYAAAHTKGPEMTKVIELAGPAHLAPIERPSELAALVAAFVPIASSRTSPQTREVLLERLAPKAPTELDAALRATLQALVERIVPGCPPEIAMRVENAIVDGPGDGWRNAALPADLDAWRMHLGWLRKSGFADEGRQEEILEKLADQGKAAVAWFEDARGLIAMTYMSDPRTMARVGFAGFADEGGFTQIRLGDR